jgi:hypothetical protein
MQQLMATVASIRDRAAADRRAQLADRLHAISSSGERPIETTPRESSPALSSLAAVLVTLEVQPARKRVNRSAVAGREASPVAQLEYHERAMYKIIAELAPRTWASSRRPLTRIVRAARREIRAQERAGS